MDEHERFMRVAIEEAHRARDEVNDPVGSVIVRDGAIVARGRNLVYTTHDPTAHAEMVALRKLGEATGTIDFSGCVLYTTYQPCPMCCGAILASGITTVVLGARPVQGGRRWGQYTLERLVAWLGWDDRFTIIDGVLEAECQLIEP
jgi:tRNA(adenine34) deaminase